MTEPSATKEATPGDGAPSDDDDQQTFSNAYAWYALTVLFIVYVFNFIDRSILNILAQSIKEDIGLSDTQIGLMGGLAFALFYTGLGVPIARLADTGVRRNILAVCLTIWSGMTAMCGFAQNFYQLLAMRIGVAVGEAGGSPPSHSMISDMFPVHRRATALGIYALGIPVGTMIGNLAGGWINEAFDWRTAFMVVGIPGVLMALVVRFTLKEPPRGMSDRKPASPKPLASPTVPAAAATPRKQSEAPVPSVADVFKALLSRKSFLFMSVGAGFHAFVGYGVGAFLPAFFIRSHGLTSSDVGTALFWLGFAGILGTFTGGTMADWLGKRDVRWYVWLPALATLISVPFAAFTYLWGDSTIAFWVYAVPTVLGSYYLAPTFAMTQGLVGLRMRALAASILLFMLNIIGMGLGPLVVGLLSDALNAYTDLAVESLRWSLVIVLIFNVISTVLYLLAARDLASDLARSHELS